MIADLIALLQKLRDIRAAVQTEIEQRRLSEQTDAANRVAEKHLLRFITTNVDTLIETLRSTSAPVNAGGATVHPLKSCRVELPAEKLYLLPELRDLATDVIFFYDDLYFDVVAICDQIEGSDLVDLLGDEDFEWLRTLFTTLAEEGYADAWISGE